MENSNTNTAWSKDITTMKHEDPNHNEPPRTDQADKTPGNMDIKPPQADTQKPKGGKDSGGKIQKLSGRKRGKKEPPPPLSEEEKRKQKNASLMAWMNAEDDEYIARLRKEALENEEIFIHPAMLEYELETPECFKNHGVLNSCIERPFRDDPLLEERIKETRKRKRKP